MSVFRRYKTCWRGLQILLTSGKNPCDPRADSPFGNLDHGIRHNMSFTQLGHICHNNTYQYYTIIIKAVNTRADICHNFNPFAERSASISTLVALITTIMARSRTLHLLNVPANVDDFSAERGGRRRRRRVTYGADWQACNLRP